MENFDRCHIPSSNLLLSCGDTSSVKVAAELTNPFWREVFGTWDSVKRCFAISPENVNLQPLFLSSFFSSEIKK